MARTIPVLIILAGALVVAFDYIMSISYVNSILPSTDDNINASDMHWHVKQLALFSALLVIAVAALVYYVLRSIVTEPVSALADTSRILNRGDYSASAHLRQVNELGEISTALDTLAIKARDSVDIEALNTQLVDIIEHTVNEVYVVAFDSYQILSANLVARQKHSLDEATLSHLHPWSLSPRLSADVLSEKLQFIRDYANDKLIFDTTFVNQSGNSYQVELTLQILDSAAPPVILMIAKDIQALTEQWEELHLRNKAMDALDVGITITDALKSGFPLTYVNKAWCRISGYDKSEMLGRPVRELQLVDEHQPAHTMIEKAQQAGESVQVVLKSKRKDDTYFMDELFLSPIHDSTGKLTHYIGINRDVTSMLETQRQLDNIQRLESVGLLSGGIAHDFNNILTVIQGNLEFLALSPNEEDKAELIAEAANATRMGARLTKRLLTFASRSQLEPDTLDINSLVLETVEILRSAVGESITLSTSLAVDLWPVYSDQSQVENAIVNLTINARDAISGGGHILIETANTTINTPDRSESLALPMGDYVVLEVSDNGSGISPENQAKVLQPFFTTKTSGKGSGLGLSTIYGFIRQIDGQLEIDSQEGRGTSIKLFFPRHVAPAIDDKNIRKRPSINTDKTLKSVLVVEDNAAIRKVSVNRFISLGYSVEQAADSIDAIDKLQRRIDEGNPFDLVFTDIVMESDTSGYEIARWMSEHCPQSTTILTSAYSNKLNKMEEGVFYLQKPHSIKQLKDTLQMCFNTGKQY